MNGTHIRTGGINQIDPCVFIDDDGLSMHDFASCIYYSTSRSPWGPFKYRGIIINNDHSDPKNWNNHRSLIEFKGQWYVFYHRASHGSNTMRRACLKPIKFNEDGKTWTTITIPMSNTNDVNAVWLIFNTRGENTFKVDWFKFE